jgi:hypothetical protein
MLVKVDFHVPKIKVLLFGVNPIGGSRLPDQSPTPERCGLARP